MDYRHEWKHEITPEDLLILRQRLSFIMKKDVHAVNGRYQVRSLYFDTPDDKALLDKINGICVREKFRLRFYNEDTNRIRLEKKSKLNQLGNKQSAILSKEEVLALLDNDLSWMFSHPHGLVRELYAKMTTTGLHPKTIVEYTREPFTFPAGNVRVTFDYNIRTSPDCMDFLNPDCVLIPAGAPSIIMEVKWDEFLPDIIRNIIWIPGRQTRSFSKYAQCRIYG